MIKKIYRKFVPYKLRAFIGKLRTRKQFILLEENRFRKIKDGTWMERCKAECEYMIEKGRTCMLPYRWTEEYRKDEITVYSDKKKHMPYVMVGNKRMYFPRSFAREQVRKSFNSVLTEQDPRSPHYYFNPSDEELKNSVFLDVGGAEGYITLLVMPYVKETVIFECEKQWVEALNATFEPCRDKVKIINRFAGAETSEETVRIDDIVKDKDNVVLKIDVEGMESEVLSGATETLKKDTTKVFVCAYHRERDEEELSGMLRQYGFETEVSDGWIYPIWENGEAGFRKGIIRAWKNVDNMLM